VAFEASAEERDRRALTYLNVSTMLIGLNNETNLNDAVFLRGRIQGILNIALANNTKMTNDIDGSRPEHVVVGVGERLGGCDHNRVSSVNAEWIEILVRHYEIVYTMFSEK
jgi:hypothetical protein